MLELKEYVAGGGQRERHNPKDDNLILSRNET